MNKFVALLVIAISVSTLGVFAKSISENSVDFLSAFKNCSSYKSEDIVEIDGISSKVRKHIIGWDGYTCKYEETVEFKDLNFKSKVRCEFTGEQVREIYGVMKEENEKAMKNPEMYKDMTLETANKSPVIKIWNKYLGDSSVCKIQM